MRSGFKPQHVSEPLGGHVKADGQVLPPPPPGISDLVGLDWDKKFAFRISSKVLLLLVQGLQRTIALGYAKEQKPLVSRAGFPSNDAT